MFLHSEDVELNFEILSGYILQLNHDIKIDKFFSSLWGHFLKMISVMALINLTLTRHRKTKRHVLQSSSEEE